MKGWVYVISNKAMPDLVKVGYSMKDPDLRAAELNHTGSPHPYAVEYEVLVEGPRDVEQIVHSRLSDHLERKEWFRCSAEEAIAAIKAVVGTGAQVENYKRADRERAEAIHRNKMEEEQRRVAAEEARMKQAAALEEARCKIMSRYEPALNGALPDINYWGYFIGVFIAVGFGLSIFFPKMKDDGILILSAIGSFIITPFVKEYLIEKAKNLDKYKAILARRDADLAALENGRGVTLTTTSTCIAVEPVKRKNISALANQMHARAQYDLGVTYAYGQGVTQDYQEALKLFRLSAEQGITEAQCDLGAMYQAGFGVPQDYVQAMMWYLIAKAYGSTLPDQNLHQLEPLSTPAQIAEAQRMAKEWTTTHSKKN